MCGWEPRFSATECDRRWSDLDLNEDSRIGAEPGQQTAQVGSREGHASRGRRAVRPCQMQEHSAAPAGNPGSGIVVDLDDDVVQGVVTPEAVAWFIGRTFKRPIVAAVAGVFAPCDAAIDAGCRQQGWRLRATIGSPPQPPQAEPAPWRGPVTFTLIGANPGSAQDHRNGKLARNQHPTAAHTWPGRNLEKR